MEIAKALILAGSTSSERPWPSVAGGPKQLVPVANRPILFHNLEALRQAGVIEAMIVVEPHAAAAIRAAVGDGSDWGLGVRYLEWAPATRLREALAAAGDYVADEPVLVEHADALMRHHLHGHLADFARERLDAVAFRLLRAPRNGDGEPMAGGYLFSRRATAILRASNVADDPLEGVQAYGGRARTLDVEGCLACHGGQDALLEGNRSMLEHLTTSVDAASLLEASEIQGPVVVHPTARLEHTLVRGPAIIGPHSNLRHAYVGPYTSIGADVEIEGTEIEHSIVLSGARLQSVGTRLETSVIGHGATITRGFDLPSAMRLSIGDGAEVTL